MKTVINSKTIQNTISRKIKFLEPEIITKKDIYSMNKADTTNWIDKQFNYFYVNILEEGQLVPKQFFTIEGNTFEYKGGEV